jgi:hypothetical protein
MSGTCIKTSLSDMTDDSKPISELWSSGRWFLAAHGDFETTAYAAMASPSKFALLAFIFIEWDLRDYSCSACTSGFATYVET